MSLSFREQLTAATLLITLVIFGNYLRDVYPLLQSEDVSVDAFLWSFARTTVFYIVLQVVVAILLAVKNPRAAQQQADEREQFNQVRASAIAYYVLAVGVVGAAFAVALNQPLVTSFHMLLVALLFSELLRMVSELYFYRANS